MNSDGRRSRRVAELIRAHLVALIARDLDDPKLSSLVVTNVEVPDDLAVAWISVRLLVGDEELPVRKRTIRALSRAAGRLRHKLAPRLGLRRVPELRFSYDEGHDASRRVEALLREIDDEQIDDPAAPESDGTDSDGAEPDS